jgi:hypothetical protein
VWTQLDLPDNPKWKDYPEWLQVSRLTSKDYYFISYESLSGNMLNQVNRL